MILNAVQNPQSIATSSLASSAFARHYSQNLVWFLFLRVLRCFSSPRSLRYTMYSCNDHRLFTCVVPQFGNLRIEAYLQLPAAYRSLSRPSSAPDAKAFTLCSFLLELLFFSSPYCLSFANNFLQWKSYFNNFLYLVFRLCFHMRPNCSLPRSSERPLIISNLNLFFNPVKLSVRFSYLVFNEHSYTRNLCCDGRPKWSRTTDLMLIRHAL